MTARWRDPSWTYHKAETHSDPAQFKARMRSYARPDAPPIWQELANIIYDEMDRHKYDWSKPF